ncbi:hypothetical protein Aduo_004914 [Ancylostoma duodenale]
MVNLSIRVRNSLSSLQAAAPSAALGGSFFAGCSRRQSSPAPIGGCLCQKALVRIGELTLFRLFCPQGSEIYDNVDMPSSSPVNGDNAAVEARGLLGPALLGLKTLQSFGRHRGMSPVLRGMFVLSAFAIYSLIPLAV